MVGNKGTVYYQIIHERKVRQLHTDYKVFPSEWNDRSSRLNCTSDNDRSVFLLSMRERIRWDIERLTKIVRNFENRGLSYTVEDVAEEFERYSKEYSLFNYMETQIVMLRQRNKARTAETYRAALNCFRKFRNDEDIMLDAITSDLIELYETSMQARGNTPNTTSFYMRIIRAVYNRAVDDGIIEDRNPFKHVYTGVEKTVKRALPLSVMRKIKALELSLLPQVDYARDMFLLSFFLRGMSFIDMAFLRKTDLAGGYIIYRRRKTGQMLKIEWTKEMQLILDKYPRNTTNYLLPIITRNCANERQSYRNTAYKINHHLKKVAEMVKVAIPLTMYCARHSWASAAKAKGIPLSVISEGMGHDSETTTQIYLASLDTSVIDKANSKILSSL